MESRKSIYELVEILGEFREEACPDSADMMKNMSIEELENRQKSIRAIDALSKTLIELDESITEINRKLDRLLEQTK